MHPFPPSFRQRRVFLFVILWLLTNKSKDDQLFIFERDIPIFQLIIASICASCYLKKKQAAAVSRGKDDEINEFKAGQEAYVPKRLFPDSSTQQFYNGICNLESVK